MSAAQPVVFCDFDGPIVDVSERYYQTYRKGLLAIEEIHRQATGESLVLYPLTKSRFWHMKKNRVADLEIALRSELPMALFKPFMQQVERIVNHPQLLGWDQLQPTAAAGLRYLQQSGLRTVLVTLRHPRQVEAFLKEHELEDLVDDIFGMADVNAAHRNRAEQKCELLSDAIATQKAQGYCTRHSWMIGDTEADIIAAQTMGISAAALSCGVRSENSLASLTPTAMYDGLLSATREVVEAIAWKAA